jgi:hypothetical protein
MPDLDAAIRAKLDDPKQYDENDSGPLIAGLLAVLDLHNPVRQGAGAKVWLECAHCQNADWGGPNVDWPCETVEAIAKELGIEG